MSLNGSPETTRTGQARSPWSSVRISTKLGRFGSLIALARLERVVNATSAASQAARERPRCCMPAAGIPMVFCSSSVLFCGVYCCCLQPPMPSLLTTPWPAPAAGTGQAATENYMLQSAVCSAGSRTGPSCCSTTLDTPHSVCVDRAFSSPNAEILLHQPRAQPFHLTWSGS